MPGDRGRTRTARTDFIGGSPALVGPEGSLLLETARHEPYLVLTNGARRGAEFPLRTTATTIGRGEEADVQIDEPAASRRHAVIERDRGTCVLKDLGSTNGTHLRGLLHGTAEFLRDGDRFRIGSTEFVFREAGS
ncbi:MAG: FHA domain-containing protein [Myxococcota bacterium]